MNQFGVNDVDASADTQIGKGWVLRRPISAREFGKPATVKDVYLPLLKLAQSKAKTTGEFAAPGYQCVKRGPFVIVRAGADAAKLQRATAELERVIAELDRTGDGAAA